MVHFERGLFAGNGWKCGWNNRSRDLGVSKELSLGCVLSHSVCRAGGDLPGLPFLSQRDRTGEELPRDKEGTSSHRCPGYGQEGRSQVTEMLPTLS